MKVWRVYAAMAVVACLAVPTGFAQRMFSAGPRDIGSAEMAKIFGDNPGFTATANISIDDAQHGNMHVESSYAFLKGNIRTDMDMSAMMGSKMSPQTAAMMKQMGMDQMSMVYRNDKKVSYMMYPGLKSYAEMNAAQSAPTDKTPAKEPKVDITEIGKETVDGHACMKNKVTFTADDGSQHEMTTWNATDMNNFPTKAEMHEGGATITTHFTNVKLSPPDASLFDPPSDYTKYGSIQEMMMGNMQRMMPPGASPHGGGNQ
jgi:Domain of unknown function (DUF4412)